MKKILLGILAVVVVAILIIVVNLLVFLNNMSHVSEGIPLPEYDVEMPALMVIDLQGNTTGETSTHEHFLDISAELIAKVNELIEASDNADVPVIYVRSEIHKPLINLINNSMAKGSIGSELDPRLKVVSDLHVTKDREDAFSNPQLDSILLQRKISKLYFVGLDAAHCVNSTIQAAQNRNYSISVISDAVVSESIEMKDSILSEFSKREIQIISMEEYLEQLIPLPER
ncbi:cysteine hydrolase family protein [Bacteroidota bacterium]